MPGDKEGKEIVRVLKEMEGDRLTWESHWREVADYVCPDMALFQTERTPGAKTHQGLYDTTAILAAQRAASIITSFVTPSNQQYHTLSTSIPELNRSLRVKQYFADLNDLLFKKRYEPKANFESAQWQVNYAGIVFGTGVKYVAKRSDGNGPYYRAMPLQEIFIRRSFEGRVDTVYRKYKLSARQAAQEFGLEMMPEKIRAALKDVEKQHSQKFEFVHAVQPNVDYEPGKLAPRFMKFASYHVFIDDQHTVRRGGYRVNPYMVHTDYLIPGEVYGRSTSMNILNDIQVRNAQAKAELQAQQFAIQPPLLVPNDGTITAMDLTPNGLVVGGVDEQGRQMVVPMQKGTNWPVNERMKEDTHRLINDAYMITLFQILVDNPQMTATEVMQKAKERGALIGPTVGRRQTEDQAPQIDREIDLYTQMGLVGDPPPELLEAEGEYSITFDAPVNREQKAEQALSTQQTVLEALQFSEVDPSVKDRIDLDEYLQYIGDVRGAHPGIFRTDDAVAAIRQQQAQQQEAANMAQMAPGVARAALDAARAQKTVVETAETS